MVRDLQPYRISTKGSPWSGALGCSNTLARRRFYTIVPMMFLALSACGPKLNVKATKPPAELMACAAGPAAPALPPYEWDKIAAAPSVAVAVDMAKAITGKRDGLMLPYVLDLRAARGDCAAKVAGTRAWADRLPE